MRSICLLAALVALCAGPAAAVEDPLLGHWTGWWEREGARLDVAFDFARSGDGYNGSFDSAGLRVAGIPLSEVEARLPAVGWKIVGDATTAVFRGTLADRTIAGQFTDGAARGTFSLTRAAVARSRPIEEEVTFANGPVRLAGTVVLPASGGRHPGVVFLHGSGAEGRWASRFLANQFAQRGVAALVYDKRGVGGSGGDWRTADFDVLAADAAAAVDALRRHPAVDAARVGIHGHSQGGTLAPLVAERVPDVAFVIASAASGLPMDEVEVFSIENSLGVRSMAPDEAALAHAFVAALVAHAYRQAPRSEMVTAWERVRDRPWAFALPADDDFYWSFSRRIADYDPPAHWRGVRAPVLLVGGEADERVPVRRSFARIAEALLLAGGDALTVRFFGDADHTFRLRAEAGGRFAWPRTAPGYPQALVDWVLGLAEAPAPSATRDPR